MIGIINLATLSAFLTGAGSPTVLRRSSVSMAVNVRAPAARTAAYLRAHARACARAPRRAAQLTLPATLADGVQDVHV